MLSGRPGQYPEKIKHSNKARKEQHQAAQREVSLYVEPDGAALRKNQTEDLSFKDNRGLSGYLQRPQKEKVGDQVTGWQDQQGMCLQMRKDEDKCDRHGGRG